MRLAARAASPAQPVDAAPTVPHELADRKVALVKGQGVALVPVVPTLDRRGRAGRATKGALTRGHPEVRRLDKLLTRTGNPECGQKVAHVEQRARKVARVARRVHPEDVLEVLRAGVLVNRVVGARRQVLVTVTAPIAQASHAQRLAVMTGSPRGRRRTSRAWALQSRHEATARSPLSPHSCVNRWYSKTFLLNSC